MSVTCLTSETRKARKKHQCGYCLGRIEPGELHHYSFIVDGGDNWPWRSHLICNSLAVKWTYNWRDNEGLDQSGWYEYWAYWLQDICEDLCPGDKAASRDLFEACRAAAIQYRRDSLL